MSTTETIVAESATPTDSAKALRDVGLDVASVLVESDDTIHMLLLHLLAKQHLLLVGTPGVAKSLAVTEVMSRITGTKTFSMLVHQAMPPDELLGHISPAKLMEDRYVHNTTGKLPEAEAAFLDELFRAGPTLLNPLLTLINERLFDNDGMRQKVPLWSVIGATNSLPSDPVLGAFRDRFASTLEIKAVQSDAGFIDILSGGLDRRANGGQSTIRATIDKAQIVDLQRKAEQVTVSLEVMQALAKLRGLAEDKGMIVSPRRYQGGLALCQAQAVLAGRGHVVKSDLSLFEHVLWLDLEDKPLAHEVASMFSGKVKRLAKQLADTLATMNDEFVDLGKEDPRYEDANAINAGAKILQQLKRLRSELKTGIDETEEDGEDNSPLVALNTKAEQFQETLNSAIFGTSSK